MRIIVAISLLLALPVAVDAQQSGQPRRIGVLDNDSARLGAFREELGRLGWIEGKTAVVETRIGGDRDFPALATELVRLKVDVIFAPTTTAVQAAKNATDAIPIVFAVAADPVGSGFVASLNSPGGNITGLTTILGELSSKRLQLLKTTVPKVKRIGVLGDSRLSYTADSVREVKRAADALKLEIHFADWRSADDLDAAFTALRNAGAEAFVVLPNPPNWMYRQRIIELAARNRLPGIFPTAEYAQAGGFMSYGPSFLDLYRRAAGYVDKILRGAKPANMPVEQATKFDLVLNLKTAKALGPAIPQSVLVQADHVIK
jgi:putative ABC transport system substrate-binding protein